MADALLSMRINDETNGELFPGAVTESLPIGPYDGESLMICESDDARRT
jgi:hypothetical protein